MLENIRILDQNILDTQQNLAICQRNIETIQSEIRKLGELESEHLEQQKRYQEYLTSTNKKIDENRRAIEELEKFRQTHPLRQLKQEGTVNESALPELSKAKQEVEERLKWETESKEKINKVNVLLAELQRNLRDIESRRGPLRDQLHDWNNRHKASQALIADFQERKKGFERQTSPTRTTAGSSKD